MNLRLAGQLSLPLPWPTRQTQTPVTPHRSSQKSSEFALPFLGHEKLKVQSIPYDDLLSALDLSSIRELEDLIIDVIYAGLLGGKLHHQERVLHVDWVAGRDVSPEELRKIANSLSDW